MKNKWLSALLAVLLCFTFVIPAFAAPASSVRVLDGADLLTASEAADVAAALDEVSEQHSMEFAIVTVDSLGEFTPADYADDTFDDLFDGADGALLLVSMQYRDWYISTCGSAIRMFTDAGIDYIGEKVSSLLSDGKYADAFMKFAELCDQFATQAETGEPYDSNNLPREPLSAIWILIAIVVGFVLSGMVVSGMKSKLKTVRAQNEAANYVRDGSMNLTNSRDLYLYHTVTRAKKADNNNKRSSGSSTHTSSSGRTHGGGGGKF